MAGRRLFLRFYERPGVASSATELIKSLAWLHLARHFQTRGPRCDAGASRAACEIACLVLFVEAIMWIAPMVRDERAASQGLSFMIIVLLVTCYVRDKRTARMLGLRLDNFLSVIRRLALPLGVFILAMIAVGWAAGTLRFGTKFYSMLLTVPLWALLQQYMLLAFANHRLRVLTGGRSAAATALMFSLLHFPNPILMIVCAAGGYIWAREVRARA